ncbi:HpcH/HpaI aldolase family protein [Hymenobacter sp. BT491]|uniref:HpcH/HpaI aldolase family protein n=1 Tax=Hymenobacter sp. BT491 TaxID=2766779 RepID=UPI00165344A6|nr:aldolase/citrate lyase family protein [Hymenobacter sp. BT491]MBC6992352.1 host specificity protein [Hymenobacter sp. BT491]
MTNRLKEKLVNGQRPLGTFVQLGGTAIVECLALAGLDYIILDTEHGPGDVGSVLPQLIAAERHGLTPLVRLQDGSRASIMRMLDSGAQGLVLPFVNSVQEAQQLVRYGKYAPLGERGFGPARGSGFTHAAGVQDLGSYLDACNREILLLPQCETRACLEHIEDIVGVPGVDGILVGPFDLSIALGRPGAFADAAFQAALARILAACQQTGKFCFIYADRKTARHRFDQGFDSVATSVDTLECIAAYQALVTEVRG